LGSIFPAVSFLFRGAEYKLTNRWLGQNSKQGKLGRQLTDIQIRMRLRASGSRQEIRETYMPMLASKIVSPLTEKGSVSRTAARRIELTYQDAVEEVISYMDEYYLGKEDWDAFVELGVDTMKEELILKKIPTATKAAFTRQ
jgi:replication factor C subunit 1